MTVSLRQRLLWILLGLILFAWITSALVTFFYARGAMLNQVDRQLEQYADLVHYITEIFARRIDEGLPLYESGPTHDPDQFMEEPLVIEGPESRGLAPAVNVWLDKKLIAVIANSPKFEPPTKAGFTSLGLGEEDTQWRVLSRYDKSTGLWIRVGIDMGEAKVAMFDILGRTLLPLMIVLPLTVAVLYLGVARGLLPLRNLADQIGRRNPGLLDPVNTQGVPLEVADIVNALNELLFRLAQALEGEQRFTANAAHELLTPLAAIKTEVQLCQRQMEQKPGEEGLKRISQRVDRASHTVEQLLTLARVDPQAPVVLEQVGLRALLVEVLADTGHLAAQRNLQVDFKEGQELKVSGNTEALAILLRNLLVNAFRYATESSTVRVSLSRESGILLEICNDCEQLSTVEFSQICDRFYRVPGSSGLGAGLGLSIASRIAELHHADLIIRPGPGGTGFCAGLRMPVA